MTGKFKASVARGPVSADVLRDIHALAGDHFGMAVHRAILMSASSAKSSDVLRMARTTSGSVLTPRAGHFVSVAETRVVFEIDEVATADRAKIVVGTTEHRETRPVHAVTRTLSTPAERHLTVLIGGAIVLQVARDAAHYTALANIANGARIAIPSLSVETIGWFDDSFHRFREGVVEYLIHEEEQLS